MNNRHLTEEEVAQYRQRTLSPTALLAADDHLAECEDCRLSLSRASGTEFGVATLWRALTATEPVPSSHLSYDDLVAVVEEDSTLERWSEIRQHLGICKACADEVADLRSLRAGMTGSGARNLPIGAAERKRWGFWLIPAWSVAAAAILVAAFVGFRALRTNIQPVPAIVAELNDAGGSIRLDSSGRLTTPSLFEPAEATRMKDAFLKKRVEVSAAISQLAPSQGTLLSETGLSSALKLTAPVGIVTPSDRPVFRSLHPGTEQRLLAVDRHSFTGIRKIYSCYEAERQCAQIRLPNFRRPSHRWACCRSSMRRALLREPRSLESVPPTGKHT